MPSVVTEKGPVSVAEPFGVSARALVLCSSMMSGAHDASQLPVVMLGRGGGQIQTGRVLNYREQPDRQMCRLYLSMMDKMGVRPGQFGDATQPLSEI